jgi:BirA family transcriptional regulator, biotin operon repressor / biotin---[acetyl-CoA-carboxylase] ligase
MTHALVRILKHLRQGPVPPGELAAMTGLTQGELRSHLGSLTQKGFDIAVHPLLGCEIRVSPDSLVAEDIASRMETHWLKDISTLAVTPSTNSLALEYGTRGARGPLAFFAEAQTAGRGRFGRVWESGEGEGLWMSLLLHLAEPIRFWPRITTLAALSVAKVIEGIQTDPRLFPQIKWPNDVLCGGKKVAGILAETGSHAQAGPFVVLGIGLNVNQKSFSPGLAHTASSLRVLCGSRLDRAEVAGRLLEHLYQSLSKIETGFDSILASVKERSSVIGTSLSVSIGGEFVEGLAEDLDPDGCLRLRMENGTLRTLSAGEVTLRSPCAAVGRTR